jgi:hypothetical protein
VPDLGNVSLYSSSSVMAFKKDRCMGFVLVLLFTVLSLRREEMKQQSISKESYVHTGQHKRTNLLLLPTVLYASTRVRNYLPRQTLAANTYGCACCRYVMYYQVMWPTYMREVARCKFALVQCQCVYIVMKATMQWHSLILQYWRTSSCCSLWKIVFLQEVNIIDSCSSTVYDTIIFYLCEGQIQRSAGVCHHHPWRILLVSGTIIRSNADILTVSSLAKQPYRRPHFVWRSPLWIVVFACVLVEEVIVALLSVVLDDDGGSTTK